MDRGRGKGKQGRRRRREVTGYRLLVVGKPTDRDTAHCSVEKGRQGKTEEGILLVMLMSNVI